MANKEKRDAGMARWGRSALALTVSLTACTAQISGPAGLEESSDSGGASGTGGGPAAGAPQTDPRAASLPFPVSTNGRPSALRRLSRDELVTSLLALVSAAPLREDLPDEPRSGHGPLLTTGLSFIGSEVSKLDRVVDTFASDQAKRALQLSGCAATGEAQRACLLDWSAQLAQQAFRRPLLASERTGLDKIIASVAGIVDEDEQALSGVLRAIFFSPSFLYRSEAGAGPANAAGVRNLTSLQIAEKLSFLSTLAPPDAELQAAANAGRLSEAAERSSQLARLSATERGKRARAVLVLEWLGANEPKIPFKASKYLEGLGSDFPSELRVSAETTVARVLESSTPTVAGLLTTSVYLSDAAVRSVTQPATSGTTVLGDDANTGRQGLLMHPLVVAAHTKEDGSSPFQIGAALREAVLCSPVAAPPPGAAALAKEDVPAGLTTRESLEYRTSAGPACTACHAQFAPIGFAFLPFDPVGRWRAQDPTQKPWDLAGEFSDYEGNRVSFDSPSSLAQSLAELPQARGCFASVALQWSLGRRLVAEDQPHLIALNELAQASGGSIPRILDAIVASPEFITALAPR